MTEIAVAAVEPDVKASPELTSESLTALGKFLAHNPVHTTFNGTSVRVNFGGFNTKHPDHYVHVLVGPNEIDFIVTTSANFGAWLLLRPTNSTVSEIDNEQGTTPEKLLKAIMHAAVTAIPRLSPREIQWNARKPEQKASAAVEPDARQKETFLQELDRRYKWPARYTESKLVGEIRFLGSVYKIKLGSMTNGHGDLLMQVHFVQVQPDPAQPQVFLCLNVPFGTTSGTLIVKRMRFDDHTRKLDLELERRYEIQVTTWMETLREIAKTLHAHQREIFAGAGPAVVAVAAAEPELSCFLAQEIRRHQHQHITVPLLGQEFGVDFIYNAAADHATVLLQSRARDLDLEIFIDVLNRPTPSAVSAYFVLRKPSGGADHRSVDLDVLEKQVASWGIKEFLSYVVRYLNEHKADLEHLHLLDRTVRAAAEPYEKCLNHAYQELARRLPGVETETLHGLSKMKKLNASGLDVRACRSTTGPFIYVKVRHAGVENEHWQEAKIYDDQCGSVLVRMTLRFERRMVERSIRIAECETGVEILQEVIKHLHAELKDYGATAATEPKPNSETEGSTYTILDEIQVPTALRMRLHNGIEVTSRGWKIQVSTEVSGGLEITASKGTKYVTFRAGSRYVEGKHTIVLQHMGMERKLVLKLQPNPGFTAENLIRVLVSAVAKYVTETKAVAATEPGMDRVSPTYNKLIKLAGLDHMRALATKTVNNYPLSIYANDDKEDMDPNELKFYISTPATPAWTKVFTAELFDVASVRITVTPDHFLKVQMSPVHEHVDSKFERNHTTFPLDVPVQHIFKFIFDTSAKYTIRKRAYNAK